MTITAHNISKFFGKTKVLYQFENHFESGEIVGVIGKNGSGKTTLLKILSGIIPPDHGCVNYGSQNILDHRMALMGKIGTLFDSTRHLYWRLTAMQNFVYFAGLKGFFDGKGVQEAAFTLFEAFGIKNYKDERVERLSLGTKRKIAICCALAHNPEYLILDEPTNGLDAQSKIQFSQFLHNESQKGKMIFVASHESQWIRETCTRIVSVEA